MHPTLAETPLPALRSALRNGLSFDFGAARLRLRSDSAELAKQLRAVYANFPFTDGSDWADLHVDITRDRGLRRWLGPQVHFISDQQRPFEPFPADTPLPLLEWGANWLIGKRLNHLLMLHAGALERDGLALLLPAVPGAGKSTLSAALSLRGWRLLSDEFGVWDPAAAVFRAMLKPVALKNESIDVIRRFAPQSQIGPVFPKTRKGDVAHLPASADAVARCCESAAPGAVILPQWRAGSATVLEPLPTDRVFPALAYNAFNYTVLGAVGFESVVQLVRRCPGWRLVYSDLDEALATIDALWPEVRRRATKSAVLAPVGT